MNVQAEKAKIKEASTARAITTRVIAILAGQSIHIDRKALWQWQNQSGRLATYDPEIIAAYWQAINERAERFRQLAIPQRNKAVKSAKKLVDAVNADAMRMVESA